MNVTITTNRLMLVLLSEKYVNEIFAEFTPEVTKHMYPAPPKHIGETREFISQTLKNMHEGNELVFVIINRNTQEFLGCCAIHEIVTTVPHTGIWIKKSAHGNQYGKEAINGLYRWVCKNLDFEWIKYEVAKENISSRKIAESLGGTVINEYNKPNQAGVNRIVIEYKIPKKTIS